MVKMPEEYRWSSYGCYIGLNGQPDWLSGAAVAQAIRRLRMASENDAKLREILNGVAKKSGLVGG